MASSSERIMSKRAGQLAKKAPQKKAGANAASLPHDASAPAWGRASFAFARALAIIAQYLALDLEVDVLRALVLACLALDGL